MAAAEPYPMPTRSGPSATEAGTLTPMAEPDRRARSSRRSTPGRDLLAPSVAEIAFARATAPRLPRLQIPYTRWSLIGRYDKFPNYAILKMFFSQDHDGNGTGSNFVCSASSMGPDEAWTAGHCVTNNLSGAGVNAGWSYNV